MLAGERGSELIALEYYSTGPYACADAQDMFIEYGVGNATPQAVFNGGGRDGRRVIGGSNHYAQYKESVDDLFRQRLLQPILVSLNGTVSNENNWMRANVHLKNLSETTLSGASLYAVIYESVFFEGEWHDVVRGVTDAISISGLGSGASANYGIDYENFDYNPEYGMVLILKDSSGQIIQAHRAQ